MQSAVGLKAERDAAWHAGQPACQQARAVDSCTSPWSPPPVVALRAVRHAQPGPPLLRRPQPPPTLTLLLSRLLCASSAQRAVRSHNSGGCVSTTSAPASAFCRSRATGASMGFSTAHKDREAGRYPSSRMAEASSSRSKLSCSHLRGCDVGQGGGGGQGGIEAG